jgi:signal transduction histidine kinase
VATPYLALLFLLASCGWFAPFRRGVFGVALILVCGLAYDTVTGAAPVADVVVNAALIILAWVAGYGLRVSTDRRVAAEVEADRAAHAAVEQERSRIARDLHDSLGHALTLMTLQAGSARERDNVGKGHATEAVTLLTDYLFARLRIDRVQLNIHPENEASRRVATKAGTPAKV